jgi:Kef-type K+ transport system membrane component KefB
MEHQMPLVLMLLLLLLAARVCGEIMERLGQMAMIGEILAGVILGPSVLNIIKPSPEVKILSDLGVFMLVMLAGMEMDFTDIKESFQGRGILIAVCGFFIPFAVGNGIGFVFHYEPTKMVFLGLCMAVTALPVSVRILMDLGRLQTELGQRIVTVGVQDDTTSLLLLGFILGMKAKGGVIVPMLITGGKTLIFFGSVATVYWLVRYSRGRIPHSRVLVAWAEKNLRGKEPLFALVLLFILSFATLTDLIGLHFVVGAFFGSMILSRRILGTNNYEEVEKAASSITMGLLGPIFFAAIGVEFQLKTLSNPLLIATVLVGAFACKIMGGYIGARLAGLNSAESTVMGLGMNGRGVMELVIADLALKRGFISGDVFSTLVVMGMVTTMLTPWPLQKAFERYERLVAEAGGAAPMSADGIPTEPDLVDDLAHRPDWVDAASGEVRQRWDYKRRVA